MTKRRSRFAVIAEKIRQNPLASLAWSVGACLFLLVVVIIAILLSFAGVNAELRSRGERTEVLKQSLSALTDDYNLLRRSLGLEAHDFPLAGLEEPPAGSAGSPLEEGLRIIMSRYYDEQKALRFQTLKDGALFKKIVAASGCAASDGGLYAIALVKKNNIYYTLVFEPTTEKVKIEAAGINESYNGKLNEGADAFITASLSKIDAYYATVADVKKRLLETFASESVALVLKQRELTHRFGGEDQFKVWAVVSKEKEDLLSLGFDKKEGRYFLDAKKIDAAAPLEPELTRALAALDTRSVAERRLEAVLVSLKETLAAAAFIAFSKESEMTVAAAPRETEDFVYFDVEHREKKIGAFAVNRESAAVYFTDKDDVQIASLQSVAGLSGLKKKP